MTNARFRSEFIINGDGKFLTLLDKDATQDAMVNCSSFNYATSNDDYHQMFDVKPVQPKYEPKFRESELYVGAEGGKVDESKKFAAPKKLDYETKTLWEKRKADFSKKVKL